MKHHAHHFRGAFCRVSVISIDHDVTIRIDLAEHAADDVALSLHALAAHDSTGARRDFSRPVG